MPTAIEPLPDPCVLHRLRYALTLLRNIRGQVDPVTDNISLGIARGYLASVVNELERKLREGAAMQ